MASAGVLSATRAEGGFTLKSFTEVASVRALGQKVVGLLADFLQAVIGSQRGSGINTWVQGKEATRGDLAAYTPEASSSSVRPAVEAWFEVVSRVQLLDTIGDLTAYTPEDLFARKVLGEALARYGKPNGYEGDLVEAAWQLEQIGKDAWPALRELAVSRSPVCEFFLGAMVRIETVPLEDRRTSLLTAARNHDANTRARLLELLEEMPASLRQEVLEVLASPEQPGDSVTESAREVFDSCHP